MSAKTRARHQQRHSGNGEMRERPSGRPILDVSKISEEERCRLIQVRAYELWEQAGKPDESSASERFWCEAEREITASHASVD